MNVRSNRSRRFMDPVALLAGIYSPLKIAQQPDRLFVYEGEKLHHDGGANPALGVDPIERIRDARPSQASRGAPSRIWGGVDQKAKTPLIRRAGMQVHIARPLRLEALQPASAQFADLVR